MRRMLSIIGLTFAVCAAHAQGFYYHSTMPDGRVIIGDKPAPGAKAVRQVPLRSGNIAVPVQPSAPAGAPPGAEGQPGTESPEIDIRNAQRELDAAKAALEGGREPQPGERLGTAGGNSRLTEAYFQRQKAAEEAVATAQKRLEEASQRKSTR